MNQCLPERTTVVSRAEGAAGNSTLTRLCGEKTTWSRSSDDQWGRRLRGVTVYTWNWGLFHQTATSSQEYRAGSPSAPTRSTKRLQSLSAERLRVLFAFRTTSCRQIYTDMHMYTLYCSIFSGQLTETLITILWCNTHGHKVKFSESRLHFFLNQCCKSSEVYRDGK